MFRSHACARSPLYTWTKALQIFSVNVFVFKWLLIIIIILIIILIIIIIIIIKKKDKYNERRKEYEETQIII